WSAGAGPLFGRSPSELQIGVEDWYQGIHPEDVERVRIKFEEFMNSTDTDWVDEYRFRRADAVYVYIYDKGRKFNDERGAPYRVAGAMVDITPRKIADAALLESEERYRSLTELSPDGVLVASADGSIHLANPSFLQMVGVAADQIAGRNLFEFIALEYV